MGLDYDEDYNPIWITASGQRHRIKDLPEETMEKLERELSRACYNANYQGEGSPLERLMQQVGEERKRRTDAAALLALQALVDNVVATDVPSDTDGQPKRAIKIGGDM
jgi:hypothetical protein